MVNLPQNFLQQKHMTLAVLSDAMIVKYYVTI